MTVRLSAKYQTESRHWYQEYAWLAGDCSTSPWEMEPRKETLFPIPVSTLCNIMWLHACVHTNAYIHFFTLHFLSFKTGWWQYWCWHKGVVTSTKPVNCPKREHSASRFLGSTTNCYLDITIVNLCSVLCMLIASYYAFHRVYSNAFHSSLPRMSRRWACTVKECSETKS